MTTVMKSVMRKDLIYPAEFVKTDSGYVVFFCDLEECMTQGDTLAEAVDMAADCLKVWAQTMEDLGHSIPEASDPECVRPSHGGFISLVRAELKDLRRLPI